MKLFLIPLTRLQQNTSWQSTSIRILCFVSSSTTPYEGADYNWGMDSGVQFAKTMTKVLLAITLFSIGVFGAFTLYQIQTPSKDDVFGWDNLTPYAPVVAVTIGAISSVILACWILVTWVKGTTIRVWKSIAGASIVWIGFGAGLLAPWVLGIEPAYKDIQRQIGNSTLYSLRLSYIDFPPSIQENWGGSKPGPYIAELGEDVYFVAHNSTPPPAIYQSDENSENRSDVTREVFLTTFSSLDEPTFDEPTNLTSLDKRIQHVRDIQPYKEGLMFTNIEDRGQCLVLQVWTASLEKESFGIQDLEMIWETYPCLRWQDSPENKVTGDQSGARLASQPDGAILVSVGDFRTGLSTNLEYSGRPSVLGGGNGSEKKGSYGQIWRIFPDDPARNEMVSSGHRNPQGLFLEQSKQILISSEHGPRAGGELNLIIEGEDYGWPDTTFGAPYPGGEEGEWKQGRYGTNHDGYAKPLLAWMPSIAPSQLIIYQGNYLSGWRGDILVATMKDESIRRIRTEGGRVLFDERIEIGERVRDMVELSNGKILLSFDSGRLGVIQKNPR